MFNEETIYSKKIILKAKISRNQFGQRLDQVLAKIFPNYSRSKIKKWILNHCVLVNGKILNQPKKKMFTESVVLMSINLKEKEYFKAQNIPLNIIYEDDEIIVINKPSDLIVHPGAGHPDGTMLNALLHYYPPIINIPRAGIVHRLDKNTTGLMVIAKTLQAMTNLINFFKLKKIVREYEAIVIGNMPSNGVVKYPIGRHPSKRTYMSVNPMGKLSITHYRLIESFYGYSRLRLFLETGRTHQIRVHMSYINHPLVGDKLYGRSQKPPKNISSELFKKLNNFNRQALHAYVLRLKHPISGVKMEWRAPIPQDMMELIYEMRINTNENKMVKKF